MGFLLPVSYSVSKPLFQLVFRALLNFFSFSLSTPFFIFLLTVSSPSIFSLSQDSRVIPGVIAESTTYVGSCRSPSQNPFPRSRLTGPVRQNMYKDLFTNEICLLKRTKQVGSLRIDVTALVIRIRRKNWHLRLGMR